MVNAAFSNIYHPGNQGNGPFHLLFPFAALQRKLKQNSREETLPDDFPDYVVYMTRKALFAATASLSNVSTQTHDFLLRLSQMLAFDRMTRSYWSLSQAVTAPWSQGSGQIWLRSSTYEPRLSPYWPVQNQNTLPLKLFYAPVETVVPTDITKAFTAYTAAISATAAAFNLAPLLFQAWNNAT